MRLSDDDQRAGFQQIAWRVELEPGQAFLVELLVEESLPVAILNLLLQIAQVVDRYDTPLPAPIVQLAQ